MHASGSRPLDANLWSTSALPDAEGVLSTQHDQPILYSNCLPLCKRYTHTLVTDNLCPLCGEILFSVQVRDSLRHLTLEALAEATTAGRDALRDRNAARAELEELKCVEGSAALGGLGAVQRMLRLGAL